MKAAMLRYLNGQATTMPFRVQVHMVAARYGQEPARVREWPADDFVDAVSMLKVTGDGNVNG